MTKRSEFEQRKLEAKVGLMFRIAPKALSRKNNGVDGMAKAMLAKQVGDVEAGLDPDLIHEDPDFEVPGPAEVE